MFFVSEASAVPRSLNRYRINSNRSVEPAAAFQLRTVTSLSPASGWEFIVDPSSETVRSPIVNATTDIGLPTIGAPVTLVASETISAFAAIPNFIVKPVVAAF